MPIKIQNSLFSRSSDHTSPIASFASTNWDVCYHHTIHNYYPNNQIMRTSKIDCKQSNLVNSRLPFHMWFAWERRGNTEFSFAVETWEISAEMKMRRKMCRKISLCHSVYNAVSCHAEANSQQINCSFPFMSVFVSKRKLSKKKFHFSKGKI